MPLPQTDTIDDDLTRTLKCQCYDCQKDREDMYGDWRLRDTAEARTTRKETTMSESNEQPSDSPLASPSCLPRPIGGIGNYYGGLSVKTEGGKHYWSIENYDGDSWDEIPAELFAALNAFEDSRANAKHESPHTEGADRNT
jgi:hypothetical protein